MLKITGLWMGIIAIIIGILILAVPVAIQWIRGIGIIVVGILASLRKRRYASSHFQVGSYHIPPGIVPAIDRYYILVAKFSAKASIYSLFYSFASHSGGMAFMPRYAPEIAPAMAAIVSVSPPRLIA